MTIPVTLIVRLFDEAGYDVTGPDPQTITFREREERTMLWQRGHKVERDGRVFVVTEVLWRQDGGAQITVSTRAVRA